MNAPDGSTASGKVWEQIEQEKRRDRFVLRLCIGAWIATIVVISAAAALMGIQASEVFGGYRDGSLPFMTLIGSLMPLIGMLWNLCLLVAALATVGVFLRFRSASLAEIQLRLAALEELLANQS